MAVTESVLSQGRPGTNWMFRNWASRHLPFVDLSVSERTRKSGGDEIPHFSRFERHET